MSAVAARLRQENRERLRRLTPVERVVEALDLGRDAIRMLASARRIGRDDARRRFERARQAGRRRSRVMDELIG